MAGACKHYYPPPSLRDFAPPKEDVQENAPSSAPSNQDELFNFPVDTKCKSEAQEESGSGLNSKHSPFPSCSSSEPEFSSQGGQPENDEKNCKRNEVFATDDHHYWESDSGEDDDGISIEELLETPGWLLLEKNVEKHFKQRNSGDQ